MIDALIQAHKRIAELEAAVRTAANACLSETARAEKAEAEVERLKADLDHDREALIRAEKIIASFPHSHDCDTCGCTSIEHCLGPHIEDGGRESGETVGVRGQSQPPVSMEPPEAAASPAARKERASLRNGPPNVNEKQEV